MGPSPYLVSTSVVGGVGSTPRESSDALRRVRSCGWPGRGRPPPRPAGRPAPRRAARRRDACRGAPPRPGAARRVDGQTRPVRRSVTWPGSSSSVASSTSRGGAAAGSPRSSANGSWKMSRPRAARSSARRRPAACGGAADVVRVGHHARVRRQRGAPWAATAAAGASVPHSSGVCPSSRSASAFAGFMNGSWPGWLRSASASSWSASASRPGRAAWAAARGPRRRTSPTASPRGRSSPGGTGTRGSTRRTRPAPAAATGPSCGADSTTSAPRRTARPTPSARSASVASAVCAHTTSSGPDPDGHLRRPSRPGPGSRARAAR